MQCKSFMLPMDPVPLTVPLTLANQFRSVIPPREQFFEPLQCPLKDNDTESDKNRGYTIISLPSDV